MSLPACKTYQVSTQPIEVTAPDSLPDPLQTNDWNFVRTSAKAGVYLPKLSVAAKVKNSYNTDNSQKKSNNTKAKGEAVVGNDNAPVKAKKQAVVGDGNRVEQEESSLPGWVWLPVILLLILLCFLWRRFR
ncbi:hypothetical protein GCM10028895_25840 [Pontibacter rugosus]